MQLQKKCTKTFNNIPISKLYLLRVEFRPCELQMTDFENAAVACFVVLLTRVILSYGYNLLVPISKGGYLLIKIRKKI